MKNQDDKFPEEFTIDLSRPIIMRACEKFFNSRRRTEDERVFVSDVREALVFSTKVQELLNIALNSDRKEAS